jgi:hypothetical protein
VHADEAIARFAEFLSVASRVLLIDGCAPGCRITSDKGQFSFSIRFEPVMDTDVIGTSG